MTPDERLHAALVARDEAMAMTALAEGADAAYQDEETGKSVMMVAAEKGMAATVAAMLQAGAPWNAIDRQGRCAGDFAVRNNHQTVVETLVSAGVAAELVFGQLAKNVPVAAPRNAEYLASKAEYVNDGKTLLQTGANDAVMMEWERPLMEAHVRALCPQPGLRVLNIGFGLGIVDGFFQSLAAPALHTIVEPHPDVLRHMGETGWLAKPNVRVVRSRWQEADLAALGPFDAVFFDSFGEFIEDLREFHALLPRILARPNGRYSFFNGMAPNSFFFQGVMCEVLRLEMKAAGFDLSFHQMEVDAGGNEEWQGVARRYFSASDYYLPLATWAAVADDAAVAESHRADRRRPRQEESDDGGGRAR